MTAAAAAATKNKHIDKMSGDKVAVLKYAKRLNPITCMYIRVHKMLLSTYIFIAVSEKVWEECRVAPFFVNPQKL